MKKMLIILAVFIGIFYYINFAIAANSRTGSSGDDYRYATVDTAPGANGYATSEVIPKKIRTESKHKQIWFSVGGSGVMTVTLQFKRNDVDGSTWNDYGTYTGTEYKLLEEGAANVSWRAIVKQGAYTSGTKIFGFGW